MNGPPYNPYPPQPYGAYNQPDQYKQNRQYQPGWNQQPSNNSKNSNRHNHKYNDDNQNPIHTVFFYSLPFSFKSEDLKTFVEKFGTVVDLYSVASKGYAFVTYDDIRDAMKAKEQAANNKVGSLPDQMRFAHANYALPKEGEYTNLSARCATVVITGNASISKDECLEACKAFGEVQEIKSGEKENTFVVNFFKISCAHDIAAKSENLKVGNVILKAELKAEEFDKSHRKERRHEKPRHKDRNSNTGSNSNSNEPPPAHSYQQPPMPPQYNPYMQPYQGAPPPYPYNPYNPIPYGYPGYPPQYPPYPGYPPPLPMNSQGYPEMPPNSMQPQIPPQVQQMPMPPQTIPQQPLPPTIQSPSKSNLSNSPTETALPAKEEISEPKKEDEAGVLARLAELLDD